MGGYATWGVGCSTGDPSIGAATIFVSCDCCSSIVLVNVASAVGALLVVGLSSGNMTRGRARSIFQIRFSIRNRAGWSLNRRLICVCECFCRRIIDVGLDWDEA